MFFTPGAYVYVYIDSNAFPDGSVAQSRVIAGVNSTQTAFSTTKVNYEFVSVPGCPANPPQPFVFISSQPMSGGTEGYNEQSYSALSTYDAVTSSLVNLDSNIVTQAAWDYLQHVSAHELSHDFGLGDCPDCDVNATVMSYQGTFDNPGPMTPTANDIGASSDYFDGGGAGGGTGVCHTPPCDNNQ